MVMGAAIAVDHRIFRVVAHDSGTGDMVIVGKVIIELNFSAAHQPRRFGVNLLGVYRTFTDIIVHRIVELRFWNADGIFLCRTGNNAVFYVRQNLVEAVELHKTRGSITDFGFKLWSKLQIALLKQLNRDLVSAR